MNRLETRRWLGKKISALSEKRKGNIPYKDWVYSIGKNFPSKGRVFYTENKWR